MFFFFKQKTAYEMRISDWSSDVCSSDLTPKCACPARSSARSKAARSRGSTNISTARTSPNSANSRTPEELIMPVLRQVPRSEVTDETVLAYYNRLFGEIGRASCRERVCQ